MKIFKKLITMSCMFSVALGMTVPAKAAIREKDIVWIGSDIKGYEKGRLGGTYVSIIAVYGKNVIYKSINGREQIYFGKTGEKTGFIFEEVVPLANGKMFFVTENSESYEGYIVDDEGNEIFTGLKDVADHLYGTDSINIENSKVADDRFICGETKEGLVIIDTKNNCKVLRIYNEYVLGTKDEIYKPRVDKRRYILITNKKKNKRAFMSISQKSGVSEIIAKNFNLSSELIINKDGEYRIVVPMNHDKYLNLYNAKGKLIWNGKNKELEGMTGNLLNIKGYEFMPRIMPYPGVSNKERGTKIILQVKKNNKYGLVRDDGRQLLAYKYNIIETAYRDMAVVVGGNYDYNYLVNYKGKKLTSKKYRKIYSFHEGRAVVEYKNKYGVISDTGKELIKPEYDDIIGVKLEGMDVFHEIYRQYGEGKDISQGMILRKGLEYIYVDKNGKEKIFDKKYERISRLADTKHRISSLLVAYYDGKFGIISANGKELYKTKYDFFGVLDKKKGVFSLGLRKHGKSGDYIFETIIDKDGKKLFEISHAKSITKLSTGEYMVKKDSSASKDKNTEQVFIYSSDWKKVLSLKNKWDNIIDYKDGLFIVSNSKDKRGVVDKSGREILSVKYDSLSFDGDCIFVTEDYENAYENGFLVR